MLQAGGGCSTIQTVSGRFIPIQEKHKLSWGDFSRSCYAGELHLIGKRESRYDYDTSMGTGRCAGEHGARMHPRLPLASREDQAW